MPIEEEQEEMGTTIKVNTTIPKDEPAYQLSLTKDKWRDDMMEAINVHVDAELMLKESWMILKPPQALLEVSPESYYPKFVTIGPFYQDRELSPLNKFKAQCVKKFMERHEISGVEDLIQYLTPSKRDGFSRIYNLNLPQSDFEWLQLLVTVDTIFIHEFLLFLSTSQPMESVCRYFAIFYNSDITLGVRIERDLLLIGNQIPMPFLKNIVDSYNHDFSLDVLEKAMRKFIVRCNPFFSSEVARSAFLGFLESKKIKLINTGDHLLDSLYYACTAKEEESSSQTNSEESTKKWVFSCFSFLSKLRMCKNTNKLETQRKDYVSLPTASQLYKAGIRFKACEGNISVMKYDKRKLRIHLPRLVLFDSTGDVLRNLIAHELTSRKGDEFSMYANIMDMLIDTPKDLAILKKAKIIENHMGNDERFVNMWNNMCINVPYNPKSKRWEQMIHDIVAHHSSRSRRWYAEFRKKFFSRPWLTISFIAAFLLLSASILQATYSGIGYYKPKN